MVLSWPQTCLLLRLICLILFPVSVFFLYLVIFIYCYLTDAQCEKLNWVIIFFSAFLIHGLVSYWQLL